KSFWGRRNSRESPRQRNCSLHNLAVDGRVTKIQGYLNETNFTEGDTAMKPEKWWSPETIFVTALGGLMTVVLGASLFAHLGSSTGSALVPATVLQKVRADQERC